MDNPEGIFTVLTLNIPSKPRELGLKSKGMPFASIKYCLFYLKRSLQYLLCLIVGVFQSTEEAQKDILSIPFNSCQILLGFMQWLPKVFSNYKKNNEKWQNVCSWKKILLQIIFLEHSFLNLLHWENIPSTNTSSLWDVLVITFRINA